MKHKILGVENLHKEFEVEGKSHFLVVHNRNFNAENEHDNCLAVTIGEVNGICLKHRSLALISVKDFKEEFNSSVINASEDVMKAYIDNYNFFKNF